MSSAFCLYFFTSASSFSTLALWKEWEEEEEEEGGGGGNHEGEQGKLRRLHKKTGKRRATNDTTTEYE